MGDVEPHEAGLAIGVVNTSFMMGGALGLAILVAVSSWWTGAQPTQAARGTERRLPGRVRIGAVFAVLAAAIGGLFLAPKPMHAPEAATDENVEEFALAD